MAVIVTILGLGRVSPRIPGPLVAVVGSIVLAGTLDWEERRGIEMVGALPAGLPTIQVPTASLADTLALVPTALIILLVCVAQSVSTASAFAIAHDDRHDPNRDLTGLGVANIVNGLGSSFVVNGSPTKTAISDKSGTQSQMAMVVLALITIPVLLFLTGVFDNLPEATLAAVVFVIAIHLMKISTLRMLWHLPSRGEFWVAVSTAAFVALVGVGGGILWAIVASIVLHLAHTSRPANVVLTVDDEGRALELPVGARRAERPRPHRLPVRGEPVLRELRPDSSRTSGPWSQGGRDPLRLFVLDASDIHERGLDLGGGGAQGRSRSCTGPAAEFVFARTNDPARRELDYHGIDELVGGDEGFHETVLIALKRNGFGDLARVAESGAQDLSRGLADPPATSSDRSAPCPDRRAERLPSGSRYASGRRICGVSARWKPSNAAFGPLPTIGQTRLAFGAAPSTRRQAPETNAAAGESRNTIAADTSLSVPNRFSGTLLGRPVISGLHLRRVVVHPAGGDPPGRHGVDPHRCPLQGRGLGEVQHPRAGRPEWPMPGMPFHMSAMMLTIAPPWPSIHCV